MNRVIARTEQAVVMTLLIAMLIVVISGTIELLIVIFQEMQKPPRYLLLDINEMLPVFGFFLRMPRPNSRGEAGAYFLAGTFSNRLIKLSLVIPTSRTSRWTRLRKML